MMRKAAGLDVDSVCLDLEDAVALNMKEEAREFVKQALNEYDFGRSEVLVRVNSVGSGLEEGDVASLLCVEDGARQVLPHGIVLPKVEHADHLLWLRERITTYALASRRITHPLSIIAIIETPTAVATLRDEFPDLDIRWSVFDAPATEVLVSASQTADQMIIGSRGRGGFVATLLGSTSQGVLAHSLCPTRVVRVGRRAKADKHAKAAQG